MQALTDEYGGVIVMLVLGSGILGSLLYMLGQLINGGGNSFFESVVMRLLTS